MRLPLQDFGALVRGMAAGVQGASQQLVDLTVGSVLRAVLEANASLALWMQWLIVQVLSMTRAATSSGVDLDTWMADFSVARLPGVAATGQVVFARFTPGTAAFIPAGTLVRTADGSQTFAVAEGGPEESWDAALEGYRLGAAQPSVTLPVRAVVAGTAGNVQANAISLMASAIPAVDTVANPAPLQNGMDAETDTALRLRFQGWAASLARATPQAILFAVQSVQQGIACVVTENVDGGAWPRSGSFLVTVDDGSGTPPASLIAAAAAAVEAVRPVGTAYAVRPPSIVPVAVSLQIGVTSESSRARARSDVAGAVSAWINTLPIGATLPATRIASVAYAASAAVTNVTGIQINGAFQDVAAGPTGVIKASSVTVT